MLISNKETILAKNLARKLNFPLILPNISYFPDGEINLTIPEIKPAVVLLFQFNFSQNINSQLVELFLLTSEIKKFCTKITAIIPYLPYSRQNSGTTEQIIHLIKALGVNKIFSCDLHKNMPVNEIQMAQLWSSTIQPHINKQSVIVAPDSGGKERAKLLAKLLNVPMIEAKKDRSLGLCDVSGTVLGKNCIIYDDIIDSGETAFLLAKKLKSLGAISCIGLFSHGIFSNRSVRSKNHDHNMSKIFVTDTIDGLTSDLNVEIVSAGEYIGQQLSEH